MLDSKHASERRNSVTAQLWSGSRPDLDKSQKDRIHIIWSDFRQALAFETGPQVHPHTRAVLESGGGWVMSGERTRNKKRVELKGRRDGAHCYFIIIIFMYSVLVHIRSKCKRVQAQSRSFYETPRKSTPCRHRPCPSSSRQVTGRDRGAGNPLTRPPMPRIASPLPLLLSCSFPGQSPRPSSSSSSQVPSDIHLTGHSSSPSSSCLSERPWP